MGGNVISGVAAAFFAYATASASGQPLQLEPPAVAAAEQSTTPSTFVDSNILIPAKSIVHIEITEEISSKTNKLGDTFGIKLTQPLVADGRTIVPTGIAGRGEVTHAAKSGWGGKAGELIINARYLDCAGVRIPLGHLRYSVAGKGNFGGAFAASQVIPMGQFLVSGRDAVIPAGVTATAQVTADVVISANVVNRCMPMSE